MTAFVQAIEINNGHAEKEQKAHMRITAQTIRRVNRQPSGQTGELTGRQAGSISWLGLIQRPYLVHTKLPGKRY